MFNLYLGNNRPEMYLLQVELGVLKYTSLQKGKINAALRVGTLMSIYRKLFNNINHLTSRKYFID